MNVSIAVTQKVKSRFRVLTDAELNRTDRLRMPMVWVFSDDRVDLTREWQYFLRAINPGMDPPHVAALLKSGLAFCNRTGVETRRNYLTNENMDTDVLPQFDKVRTCGNSELEMIGGVITMMDGTKSPPLKPGYSQPETLGEATLEKYLYTPRSHPNLFFACVSTGADLNPNPFPNGALYDWYKGGMTPVSFLPHVSPAKITYPPKDWTDNTPTFQKLL